MSHHFRTSKNGNNKDALKSKDKVVVKMTRDGLVEQNLTSGEDKKISKRRSDFDLRSHYDTTDIDLGNSINDFSEETPLKSSNQAAHIRYFQVGNTFKNSNKNVVDDNPNNSSKRKVMRIRRKKAYSQEVKNADNGQLSVNKNDNKQQKTKPIREHRTSNIREASVRKSMEILPSATQPTEQQRRYQLEKDDDTDDFYQTTKDSNIFNFETITGIDSGFLDITVLPHKTDEHPFSKTSQRSSRSEKFKHGDKRNKPKYLDENEQNGDSEMTKSFEQSRATIKVEHSTGDNQRYSLHKGQATKKDNADNSLKRSATDSKNLTTSAKISKLEHKTLKTAEKLDKAKANLPTKRKLRKERVFNEEKGESKTRLTFDKVVVSKHENLKGSLPMRPVKLGANMAIANAHRKIYQVEHENVGTKAAHRTELVAEGLVRSGIRHLKTSPYKKAAKLERLHIKQSSELAYTRILAENPKLKKNPLNRLLQKQRIKKQYAKAARKTKRAEQTAKKAKTLTSKTSKLLINVIKKNPKVIIITLLLISLIYIITSILGMLTSGGGSGLGGIIATTYLADEQEIEAASLAYSEWEMDLMLDILRVEESLEHQGYDEYRYNTGDISHNPFELMAYLTATKYMFTYSEIEAELKALFDEQYQLSFTASVETKYLEEETGEFDDEGNPITTITPYDWHVLTVTLTAKNFTDVIYSKMTTEQKQHYNLLIQTRGQRQIVANPFSIGWIPYLTSEYGYRIHPISGTRDLHRGIDIALPLGTEILAGLDGSITFAGNNGGFGNIVVIRGNDSSELTSGLEVKYAHMNSINVTNGQTIKIGDVIGTVGNTGNSTGAHLHLEVLRNGAYLNPLFFTDLGNYDYSNPLNPSIPQNNNPPRSPMNNDVWNNLIEVAESKLNLPYVFGANGPNAYDCSSFVSAVFRESGVKDVGRQTAQGLYNLSSAISDEPQQGDLFFLTGTYSTSNYITHVGFFIGYDVDGRPFGIHAGGSKVQYVYLDTPYYEQHWAGWGRLN